MARIIDVEPCELHEVSGCAQCSGRDRTMVVVDEDSAPFKAKYPGQCDECDLPIMEGAAAKFRFYWGGRRAVIHGHC
jgi:hypothetical protein